MQYGESESKEDRELRPGPDSGTAALTAGGQTAAVKPAPSNTIPIGGTRLVEECRYL